MKNFNKLLIAAIIGIALTPVFRVSAEDELLSPRAKENQIKSVSGTTADLLDRSILAGSPKGILAEASLRKVPGTTPDVLDRSYASIPKLREQSGKWMKEFQVAPLK